MVISKRLTVNTPERIREYAQPQAWRAVFWSLLVLCPASLLVCPPRHSVLANICIRLSPCQKFGYAEAVFVGRMIHGAEPVSEQVVAGPVIYREAGATQFSLEEVFKGYVSPLQVLNVPRFVLTCGGGRTEYSLIRGERYLVFAKGSGDGAMTGSAVLVSEAGEDLELLSARLLLRQHLLTRAISRITCAESWAYRQSPFAMN